MSQKLEKKVAKERRAVADEKQELLQDMFNDLYRNRRRIYSLNFIRGIFFGLGTFLGGTVVIAFIVWILSQFIDWPWVAKLIQTLQP